MPEGPSLVILKEQLKPFTGRKVTELTGNTTEPVSELAGERIKEIRTWGKHLLICFGTTTIRMHFLLFGSYRINERRESPARLSLHLGKDEINFYACSVKLIQGDLDEVYDWEADVMSERWKPRKATIHLRDAPKEQAADALLDQDIFSGVGNIIKNEVLFRIRVQPESRIGALPTDRLSALVREARKYSFQFLEWKKKGVLKKNWLAHRKQLCARCKIPLTKKVTGKRKRQSYFCRNCQVLYK